MRAEESTIMILLLILDLIALYKLVTFKVSLDDYRTRIFIIVNIIGLIAAAIYMVLVLMGVIKCI